MPDVPVLPEPPAREGEGARRAVDPREVLALRELLDALQARPEDELAGEAGYRASYRAWRDRRPVAVGPPSPQRRHRGRAVRVAVVTGVAVATLAGTAAALTGTLPGRPDPAPSASGHQAPRPSASGAPAGRAPGAGPATPSTGPRPTAAPTGPGPVQAPRTPAASGSTAPASPPKSPPVLPPATPRPTPTTSPAGTPDTKAVLRLCVAVRQGQLQPGSPDWQTLAAAAGREERIPPFCDALLGPAPPPTKEAAPTRP